MFDLSIEKLFVLLVVALFVLGPERLPAAAAWLGQSIRWIRGLTDETRQRLREDLGPDYDEVTKTVMQLRAPLHELRHPRVAAMRYLTSQDPPGAAAAVPEPSTPTSQAPRRSGERPPVDLEAT